MDEDARTLIKRQWDAQGTEKTITETFTRTNQMIASSQEHRFAARSLPLKTAPISAQRSRDEEIMYPCSYCSVVTVLLFVQTQFLS